MAPLWDYTILLGDIAYLKLIYDLPVIIPRWLLSEDYTILLGEGWPKLSSSSIESLFLQDLCHAGVPIELGLCQTAAAKQDYLKYISL